MGTLPPCNKIWEQVQSVDKQAFIFILPKYGKITAFFLKTLCIQEAPKQVLFANSDDPDESIISGSTLFVKVTKIFRQKKTISFENYNPTSLDMYNGLSQVYCIKPEGKPISIQRVTVNRKFLREFLFSRIALKDILAMLKIHHHDMLYLYQ